MPRKRPPPKIGIDFGVDDHTGETYVCITAHLSLDVYRAPWLALLEEHQRAAGTISRFVVTLMTRHPWFVGQVDNQIETFHQDPSYAPSVTIDMPAGVTDPDEWSSTITATLQEILTADATAAQSNPDAA